MINYTLDDTNSRKKTQTLINKFHQVIEANPPGICPIKLQLSLLETSYRNTCGKCTPCRDGLKVVQSLLRKILYGDATMETFDELQSWAKFVSETSDCAIGYDAAQVVLDGTKLFKAEYISHIENKACEKDLAKKVPCQTLCPTHIDVPGYIALINSGDYAGAINVIRRDNPFPTACGIICEHPCEDQYN